MTAPSAAPVQQREATFEERQKVALDLENAVARASWARGALFLDDVFVAIGCVRLALSELTEVEAMLATFLQPARLSFEARSRRSERGSLHPGSDGYGQDAMPWTLTERNLGTAMQVFSADLAGLLGLLLDHPPHGLYTPNGQRLNAAAARCAGMLLSADPRTFDQLMHGHTIDEPNYAPRNLAQQQAVNITGISAREIAAALPGLQPEQVAKEPQQPADELAAHDSSPGHDSQLAATAAGAAEILESILDDVRAGRLTGTPLLIAKVEGALYALEQVADLADSETDLTEDEQ